MIKPIKLFLSFIGTKVKNLNKRALGPFLKCLNKDLERFYFYTHTHTYTFIHTHTRENLKLGVWERSLGWNTNPTSL